MPTGGLGSVDPIESDRRRGSLGNISYPDVPELDLRFVIDSDPNVDLGIAERELLVLVGGGEDLYPWRA